VSLLALSPPPCSLHACRRDLAVILLHSGEPGHARAELRAYMATPHFESATDPFDKVKARLAQLAPGSAAAAAAHASLPDPILNFCLPHLPPSGPVLQVDGEPQQAGRFRGGAKRCDECPA